MSKPFEISEQFFSLEGEAQFTAHPTYYIRFARCNFKCPLFNNVQSNITSNGYAELGFNPKEYNSLGSLPLISKGCDSQYSVNPEFSHIWMKRTAEEIIEQMFIDLPQGLVYKTGLPVILSLTGGEPTLMWKRLPEFLFNPKLKDCRHILVETNCTVPFKDEFVQNIYKWLKQDSQRIWTWSNSPKISSSGETRDDAIKPNVALMQQSLITSCPGQVNQYFKFVCRDQADIDEVGEVMKIYHSAGIRRDAPVWIMPMACTAEQQNEVSTQIAQACMKVGYLYSHRLQNTLWGNGVGT